MAGTFNALYHLADLASDAMAACGWAYDNIRITKEYDQVNCATCKSIIQDRKTEQWNKEFDEQLWVFTAVNYDTGAESVLYGHATNHVYIQALAKAHSENSWLKTEKYIDPKKAHKCDYDRCEGHPNEWNYCSMTRRFEDDLL